MGLTDDQGDRISTGAKAHHAFDSGTDEGHARDSTQDQLNTMKKEIDALQIGVGESTKPWYKQASTLIAVMALLFSFGTTYYSNRQTRLQNIHNAKVELRGLIKEIEAASLANVDVQNKYKDNPQALGLASSLARTRQIVLITQAADIVDLIPEEITATEYYAIGSALNTISPGAERILRYLERGLAKADNIDSYLAISRSIGLHYFTIGDYQRGRASFTNAITFDRFPQVNESSRRSYNAFTHMSWASVELSAKHCLEAIRQHEEAQRLYQQLSSEGGNYSTFTSQLEPQEQLLRRQC